MSELTARSMTPWNLTWRRKRACCSQAAVVGHDGAANATEDRRTLLRSVIVARSNTIQQGYVPGRHH